MQTIIPASYKRLRGEERTIAYFAMMARCDTIHGGCKALVLAQRISAKHPTSPIPAVVNEVYRESSGKRSHYYEGWECPECGQARLGRTEAIYCCIDQEYLCD